MNGMTARPAAGRSPRAAHAAARIGPAGAVLLALWLSRNADRRRGRSSSPRPWRQTRPKSRWSRSRATSSAEPAEAAPAAEVPNVTLRDLDGKVVFHGTVDVQSTLDRIAAGKRLSYRNDGSTFENRERRLPRKPSGYYREYVHPTPSLAGPGPQRFVVGEQGEVYYTPDHYRTFKRIR